PVVPKAANSDSGSSALQRAREKARNTSLPKSSTPNQPTTAQRIQRDRLLRARGKAPSTESQGSTLRSTGVKTTPSRVQPETKGKLSAGASRIQAARERIQRTRGTSEVLPTANKQGATSDRIKGAAGAKDSKSRMLDGRKSREKGNGVISGSRSTQDKSRLQAWETQRSKTARKDYLDSKRKSSISGGSTASRPGGLTASRPGGAITSQGGAITAGFSGRGGAITEGSGHGRNLWRHNDHGYRCDPYSNYYWNWSIWGSGYGWFWCPMQWATTCWWDTYWYYGGYWSYGYRPSFYYCGPFTPPRYTIIVQTNPDPVVIREEVHVPAAQVAEAVAPAPVAEPAINRAAEYYLTLGDRAFRAGRYTDAVHHYGKAVEYSPGEGILYLILSDALFATGDYHYGAFTLRRALELDPSLVDLTVDKRSFYGRPSDLDAQMTRARTFQLHNPTDGDARLMLVANELFTGNPAGALRLLEEPEASAIQESGAGMLLKERAQLDLLRAQAPPEGDAPTPTFEVVPLEGE
ncbi:MAG: hypothetical protein KDB61_08215, partial [Planctomycetes bacterium]|nr:hypothetical protein [Planctomycetota bacterium]